MIRIVCIILFSISIISAGDSEDSLRLELSKVKSEYLRKRDSLKSKTVARWQIREQTLKESSEAKERAEEFRRELEDLYNSLSLYREENYSYKNGVIDLEEREGIIREQNRFSREVLLKHLNRAEVGVGSTFPMNQQERMQSLNSPFLSVPEKTSSSEILHAVSSHYQKYLREGTGVTAQKSSIVTNSNELVETYTLRFGNLFAYALEESDSSRIFYLSGTGDEQDKLFTWRDVSLNFNVEAVTPPVMSLFSGNPYEGILPVDLTNQKIFKSGISRKSSLGESVVGLVEGGGVTMYPLMGILLWAVIIILVKLIYFGKYRMITLKTERKTATLLRSNSLQQLTRFLSGRKDRLARIGFICLGKGNLSRDEQEDLIREEVLKEVPHLEKGLGTLAVLASSAPLLGLFGTVTGMIRMFDAITRFGTGDPKLLAGGISEALITTEVGLAIAIPLLLIHNFLRNRRVAIVSDIEIYVQKLLNRVHGGCDE